MQCIDTAIQLRITRGMEYTAHQNIPLFKPRSIFFCFYAQQHVQCSKRTFTSRYPKCSLIYALHILL